MINVLIFGVSPNMTTGYGKVSKYLLDGLKKDEDINVWHFGLQTLGLQEDKTLLPAGPGLHGEDMLPIYLKKYDIDVLVTVMDNWLPGLGYISDLVKSMDIKHISHVTINSVPCPLIVYNPIKKADYLVAPSNFVKEQLDNVKLTNSTTIYHGINTNIFKPKEVPRKNKEFTFISIGTNRVLQKNWLGLLKSLRYLITDLGVKNVKMTLVTELNVPQGEDFETAVKQAGVEDYVDFVQVIRNIGLTEKEMANIINAHDCYVTASFGESFGLGILESMACGLPAITPDFSAMAELVDGSNAGYKAKILDMFPIPHVSEQGWVDYKDLAQKMKDMMDNKEDREKFSKNGIEFAKKNTWELILPQWINLIKEVGKPSVNYFTGDLGI